MLEAISLAGTLALSCGGHATLNPGGSGGGAETGAGSEAGYDAGTPDSLGAGGGFADGGACNALPTTATVATGEYHTCAITDAGGVRCWGANFYSQLGAAPSTNSTVPVDVPGLSSGIVSLSAGWASTCALTASGGVKCWGYNSNGQLGNNSMTDSSSPVDVTGLSSDVVAISVGNYHACALTTVCGVKCWGVDYANLNGLQGNPSTSESPVPVDIVGLSSGVAAVSVGGDHSCVLTSAGGVKCWGFNANGQLGNNSTEDSPVPVDVVGLSSGVVAVSAGDGHTCALTSAGGVQCWGLDNMGELRRRLHELPQ